MAPKAKCRHCGKPMSTDKTKRAVCVNKECIINKKTKLICQKCQVVMEDRSEGKCTLHRCPVCGVSVKSA